MEFTLLFAAALGVGTAWVVDRRRNRDSPTFDDILSAGMVGLIVGRLAAMILSGSLPWQHLTLIPLVRAGVHPGWAGFAAIVWLVMRLPQLRLAGLAIPTVAGLAGWEAGCLVTGTCEGVYVGDSPLPTGLIAAAALAVAGFALTKVPIRRLPAAGLAAAAGIRLVVEPLRSALDHRIAWWYLAGLIAAILWLLRPEAFAGQTWRKTQKT